MMAASRSSWARTRRRRRRRSQTRRQARSGSGRGGRFRRGWVFVFDASQTDPAALSRAREALSKLLAMDRSEGDEQELLAMADEDPLLLVANKQDVKGALEPRKAVQALGLDRLMASSSRKYRCIGTTVIGGGGGGGGGGGNSAPSTFDDGLRWLLSELDVSSSRLSAQQPHDPRVAVGVMTLIDHRSATTLPRSHV